jgi:DNA-binding response OmpR family regulator
MERRIPAEGTSPMTPSGPVLLVDDDPGIRNAVTRALATADIRVVAVPDGASARAALETGDIAMVLLDVNLPDVSGLDLCEEIHARHTVPVAMLTVVSDEADIVRALESGADDYIRKPFGVPELIARVRAVLRRARLPIVDPPSEIRAGALTLDTRSYRARLGGDPLDLTPTEYRLLAYMVQNAARVLSHDQLLSSVWGPGYEGEHHMLHVTMSRLRQKLTRLSGASLIRTTPGVGYEFVADERSQGGQVPPEAGEPSPGDRRG